MPPNSVEITLGRRLNPGNKRLPVPIRLTHIVLFWLGFGIPLWGSPSVSSNPAPVDNLVWLQQRITADEDLAYLQQIRQRMQDISTELQSRIWRQQLQQAETNGAFRLAGLIRVQLSLLADDETRKEVGHGLLHPDVFRHTTLGAVALERVGRELDRDPGRFADAWTLMVHRELVQPVLAMAYADFFNRAMEQQAYVAAGDIVAWSVQQPDVPESWRQWAEASLAHRAGQRAEALEKLTACLRGDPLSPGWLRAESLGREILNADPLAKLLTVDEARRIGTTLLDQNRYAPAWRCLQTVISRQKDLPATDPVWFQAGLVNLRLGNCRNTLRHLERYRTDDPARQIESLSRQAICLRRLGRSAEFEKMMALLRRSHPTHEEYLRLLQAAAYDAEIRGDEDKIEEYYREIESRFPDTSAATEATWKLAWEAYRRAEFEAAAELFLKTVHRDRTVEYAVPALYWYGVVQLRRNERIQGRGALTAVSGLFPYGYYAALARTWLSRGTGDNDAAQADRRAGEWSALLQSRLHRRATVPLEHWSLVQDEITIRPLAEAHASGLAKQAYRALVALEEWVAEPLRTGYYESRARLAGLADDPAAVIANFNQAHPEWTQLRLDQLDGTAWDMLFPRKYLSAIEPQVEGHDIDPLLVLALIRQESAFREDARSSSNAYGLMQLLTGTAAAEMRYRGSRHRMAIKLLDPAYNIQAGCRHLRRLWRTFDGRMPLALAAYNGGTRRVKATFERNRSALGLAEIIELIPMSQSRNYVKYVLRNYNYYTLLYRGQEVDFGELFPE